MNKKDPEKRGTTRFLGETKNNMAVQFSKIPLVGRDVRKANKGSEEDVV